MYVTATNQLSERFLFSQEGTRCWSIASGKVHQCIAITTRVADY